MSQASTKIDRQVYKDPNVYRRFLEFLGGDAEEETAAVYITHTDGYRVQPHYLQSVHESGRLMERGLDIDRSLLDEKSLLVHLDIEYVNFDSPAACYLNPARSFELQEPVIMVIEELLLKYGIRPLHLLAGQGHHFIWRVELESVTTEDLCGVAAKNPPRGRPYPDNDIHLEGVDELLAKAFLGLGRVMEFFAHEIKTLAAPKSEMPVEITAVHVGYGAAGSREMISIDTSEYGDPLWTRVIRLPFSNYLKPWENGVIDELSDHPPFLPMEPPFSPSPISSTTSSGTPRKKQTSSSHLRVHAIGVSVLVGTIFLSISPGLAQDAEFIAITKSQHFEQFTPLLAGLKLPAFVDAEDAPFRFEAFAEAAGPGLMTAATVTLPGGLMYPLPMLDESEWATVEGFGIFGQMEAAYPPGTYQIQVDTAHDGSPIVDLDLPATGYPTLTTFLNFEAAQIIDATVPFTVTWNPIPGGTEDDVVSFEIDDVMSSPDIGEPGQLTGLDTEFTIPGGTLEPGKEYSASLRVFRPVDSDNSYSGVFTVSALGKTVQIPLRTIGGTDTENPLFLFSTPAPGTVGVDLNSIVTFWFNEAMDPAVDPDQAIDWSGVSDPSLFSYSWSRDRQRLFCNYGPGLPLSTTVQWTLNPPSASDSLRDMAGNPLPEGTSGHFITSDVSNLGEPDVRSLFLGKAKSFYQDGSAPEEIGLYSALLFAELNGIGTVSRVGLEIPGRGVAPNLSGWSFGFREIESDLEFAEASDLNRIFPSGDYTVILQTAHDGIKRVPLSIGADAYPNAPVVRDFASTQEIDSNRPFTLEWNAMTGGTSADFIELVIEGEFTSYYESPAPGEPGALDGTATSITIPPGTLPPGRTLWAELGFAKVIDTESGAYPGVEVAAAFTSITYLQLRTSGPPFQPQLQIEHMGTQAKVTVTGEIGHQYELRASDNLQDWFVVAAGFLDSDRDGYKASFEFLDEIMGISQRFYQAVEMPFRN